MDILQKLISSHSTACPLFPADLQDAIAEITALRRWIEGQECRCSFGPTLETRGKRCWGDTPCPRCQLVATWGGKVSNHPGLKERTVGDGGPG